MASRSGQVRRCAYARVVQATPAHRWTCHEPAVELDAPVGLTRDDPDAVVFDFVPPVGAAWGFLGARGQRRGDEAGGERTHGTATGLGGADSALTLVASHRWRGVGIYQMSTGL